MTETKRRRPAGSGTSARSRSAAPAEREPPTTPPPREPTALEEAAKPPVHPAAGRGWTFRVPFVTVTLGPQPIPPAPAGSGQGTVERLVFYGGVATLGVLGVLEWPVAAAIATGTWVAQHTLPRAAG